MNLCRNCIYWQQTQQWKGNCQKHPWDKDKYSEEATALACKDYINKYVKYQVASSKEA